MILHEYDVPLLGVGRDGAGDGGEPVRVQNGLLRPQELGQLLLQVDVDVGGAVERAGAARTDAEFSEGRIKGYVR